MTIQLVIESVISVPVSYISQKELNNIDFKNGCMENLIRTLIGKLNEMKEERFDSEDLRVNMELKNLKSYDNPVDLKKGFTLKAICLIENVMHAQIGEWVLEQPQVHVPGRSWRPVEAEGNRYWERVS